MIGRIIREERIKNNISQRGLAKKLNISKSYMNNIENNKVKKLSFMILFDVCKELQLNEYKTCTLFLGAGYSLIEINQLRIFKNLHIYVPIA